MPPKNPASSNLGFLLADTTRLMRRRFQECDSKSGLTYAQARALVYIARFEGRRQVELAEGLEIQPMTLARLVDQLQAQSLVERRPDPQDRRAHRLYITEAAQEPLREIRKLGQQVYDRMLAGLDQAQQDALLSALELMRSNLIND
ncbi:MarR family transcriptional regulator [Marinobacterium nitratireducens]|uniref:MarR family transcriptional regulator n=1 Tax=Marinobacterium nitratireducens TaxID=518897 RepID=A0A917ZEH5_9GAMM|nr:MarR family winged helix-turn-helix transcriptional regulator [Marinobacterium nitratireducens]GGO80357.1 MarR family transcriptional regulator [Marinobacterium nitratireducens]